MRLLTYLRFVRFEHTLFSLPLLFAGTLLGAGGFPSARLLLLVLLAGTGARTAALALNRIIDRRIDARNPRTRDRELPSGRMRLGEAWVVAAAGTVLYLGAAAALGPLCFALSPIPLAIFAAYPFLKRFTPLAHFGVGAGLAAAPLGGWIAASGDPRHAGPALLLAGFTLLWVTGFDIIYATLDEEFDRREGIRALPAALGRARAIRIAAGLHAAAFGALVALQILHLRTPAAVPFLAGAGAFLWLEHARARNVDFAFFRANIVVGFAVLGMVAAWSFA